MIQARANAAAALGSLDSALHAAYAANIGDDQPEPQRPTAEHEIRAPQSYHRSPVYEQEPRHRYFESVEDSQQAYSTGGFDSETQGDRSYDDIEPPQLSPSRLRRSYSRGQEVPHKSSPRRYRTVQMVEDWESDTDNPVPRRGSARREWKVRFNASFMIAPLL